MTLAMKMMDERKEAFEQGQAKGRAEGEVRGRAEGERISQIKTIKRMLARGLSLEEISDMIGLELDEAERLAQQE